MTTTAPATAAVSPAPWCLPCPAWCVEHHAGGQVHVSEWILWEADDTGIWFQMARHDDNAGERRFIGQTDFTLEVTTVGRYAADGSRADGFLTCNQLRELSRFMHDLAEQTDPSWPRRLSPRRTFAYTRGETHSAGGCGMVFSHRRP